YYYDHGYKAFLLSGGHVTELGNLGLNFAVAYALNSAGQVVGNSKTKDKLEHAFLYNRGVMIDLGTLGGDSSAAHSINSRGQITGYAYDVNGDFLAFLGDN